MINRMSITDTRHTQVDSRRNLIAFGMDMGGWNIGTYFIPVATVLTALAAQLTENKALVGLVGLAWSAGWALPQLFFAPFVQRLKHKKPVIIIAASIGRQAFLLLGVLLWFSGAADKTATLWLLIGCVAVFGITDGIASVAWFDVFAKSLSSSTRNTLFASVSFGATLIGIACNLFLVRGIFNSSISFPANYGLVILLGWLMIFVSFIGILIIKEPHEAHPEHAPDVVQHGLIQQIRSAIGEDQVFRRLLLARLFTAFEGMAAPFYFVFAQEQFRLGNAVLGDFNTAYNAGSLFGIAVMGALAARWGSLRVIHASSGLQLLAPLIPLVLAVVPFLANSSTIGYWVMLGVIAITGTINHSMMLGFLNYTLDLAPAAKRPMYMGTLNVMYGVLSLTPPLGGLIIDAFPRGDFGPTGFGVLFGGVSLLVTVGVLLGRHLPNLKSN